jgi:hypothetical protein
VKTFKEFKNKPTFILIIGGSASGKILGLRKT